jgi:hypothetical protein
MPPPAELSVGDIRFVMGAARIPDSIATGNVSWPHLTTQSAAGWAKTGAGTVGVTVLGVTARGNVSGILLGGDVGVLTEVSAAGSIAIAPPINRNQTSADNGSFSTFAESRPFERWKVIARTNTTDFVFAVASLLVAFGSLLFAFKDVVPHIRAALLTSAFAATQKAADAASAFDIGTVFVALFAMMLVWSVAAMTFSKTPRVYKAAADTNKTLLGVLLGYFGGKAR